MTNKKDIQAKEISNKAFLTELEERLINKKITRRDILKLVGIRYCLECKKDSAEQLTIEGFCPPCETNWNSH